MVKKTLCSLSDNADLNLYRIHIFIIISIFVFPPSDSFRLHIPHFVSVFIVNPGFMRRMGYMAEVDRHLEMLLGYNSVKKSADIHVDKYAGNFCQKAPLLSGNMHYRLTSLRLT